jgi:hypothetical protein
MTSFVIRAALLALLLAAHRGVAAQSAAFSLQSSTPIGLSSHMAHGAAFGLQRIVPRDSSEQRVAGFVLIGAGVLHLALLPVCFNFHSDAAETACLGTSAVLGVAALTVGTILLINGFHHTSRRQRRVASWLSNWQVAARDRMGMVSYRASW